MYVFNLQSLVLSGVSVLRDGQTVTARLGFGYPTASHLRANPIPMRHSDCRTIDPDANATPTEPEVSVAARQRAGRLDKRTGVLVTNWTRGLPNSTRRGTWPTVAPWSCSQRVGSHASAGLLKVPHQALAPVMPANGLQPFSRMQRASQLVIRGKFA